MTSFCVAFLFTICLTPKLNAQTWSQYGGSQRFHTSAIGQINSTDLPAVQWTAPVGDGLSGMVLSKQTVITQSLDESKEGKVAEAVIALDRESGQPKWRFSYPVATLKDQEAFGGRKRSPQATPAIIGNTVVTIGFTGKAFGLDLHTGKKLWQVNAVEEWKVVPVQFGFSASPVPLNDRALILFGGKQGGLVSIQAQTGKVDWKFPCGEASYATPLIWKHKQGLQVIFQDRHQLIGANAKTGKLLWRYDLPKPGLTNVPTPLIFDNQSLIISGQGIGGTKRIQIQLPPGNQDSQRQPGESKAIVKEIWHNRAQFFYCNWTLLNGKLIGCDDKLTQVIEASTGKTLAKWRGFENSNIVVDSQSKSVWILDGQGRLTTFSVEEDAWKVNAKFRLFEQRVWTPLAVDEKSIYGRAGQSVIRFDWVNADSLDQKSVERLTVSKEKYPLRLSSSSAAENPVEVIVESFGKSGPKAAWETYEKIRQSGAHHFPLNDRLELIKIAAGEGFYEIAQQIAEDAIKDCRPDDPATVTKLLKQAIRMPSSVVSRGRSGLQEVELAIANPLDEPLELYVVGPPKKQFRYGITLPGGKTQIVKWPVGTELFIAENDQPKTKTIQVSVETAGKVIGRKIFAKPIK